MKLRKSFFTHLIPASLIAAFLFSLNTRALAASSVVINEFMASNGKTLADVDGDFSDWMELYNSGTTAVNLSGWSLTDDPSLADRWYFPSITMQPGSFMVVFASGKDRTNAAGQLHTSFSLKADGDYLALLQPDLTKASEFSPVFPSQVKDYSYGFTQTVRTNQYLATGGAVRVLVPANGNLGSAWQSPSFDDATWQSGKSGVGYQTSVPGFFVRNIKSAGVVNSISDAEALIATPASQAQVVTETSSVLNYMGTGGGGNYGADAVFPGAPAGADIDDFVIEAVATITIPSAGSWTFGVNSDDGFSLSVGTFNSAFPDPRGPSDTLAAFNFPAAGDYPLRLVMFERGGGASLELFAAKGDFAAWDSSAFHLVGDTASGGLAVRSVPTGGTGGYANLIGADVQSSLAGKNSSIYIRAPFNISDPAAIKSLTLRMKYDDGFVAFINGVEVARRNAPAAVSWNSAAVQAHPTAQAMVFEDISLALGNVPLISGKNVLAIQGLNVNATDADFLIDPELLEFDTAPADQTAQFFSTPTPGLPNLGGFIAFVDDTKFSVSRGFYDQPFDLSITSGTAGATIRYTTNGVPPDAATGQVYTGPIRISGTATVRAAAFKTGFVPSNVDTETYIFLDDVIHQEPAGTAPGPGWMSNLGNRSDSYGMDPNIVNNAAYSATIKNDLKDLPTFSIVTDLKNLFDPSTGIYTNPGQDGRAWERPCSVELINPDGTKGFQVNAGLRIRGGFSRSTDNPKHGLRFFFRDEYGKAPLKYPLNGPGGTDTFDTIDLRTFQNYSWSFQGDPKGIFVRDQFSRDTQLAMGHNAERGNYFHLYINGQYWGLYNTCERPEASYGETYFGGKKENYDVIKVEAGPYTINATDGDMEAWKRLYNASVAGFANNASYFKVQGRNPDGTVNPAYENLIEIDNLIDYMLVIFYGGNLDAPISNFLGNTSPNNWYGMRDRTGTAGFRFFAHDSEHTLLDVNQDRTGPFTSGDGNYLKSNPQWVFQKLIANPEFKLRFADRVQKHFFNNGALTPQAAIDRLMFRKNQIDRAVVAESARWGDSKREPALTRTDWLAEINRVVGSYMPQRSGIVLNQFRAKGWLPSAAAPVFNQTGGNINAGFALTLSGAGSIYYTEDGSDPRQIGDAVAPSARAYNGPVILTENTHINARARNGAIWSPLVSADFVVIQRFQDVIISEIMYNPAGTNGVDGDSFEFLELKNTGSSDRDLSGAHFTNGIAFTFPNRTVLAPGAFLVLVSDPAAFGSRYPGIHFDGVYTNKLSNGGESLALIHASGDLLASATFGDQPPWPQSADGAGFSLVLRNPNANPDPANPENWRASFRAGGSPGADDPTANVAPAWITEVLTHTDPPDLDAIEVFNPNAASIDLSGWYLTDDRNNPKKFKIPGGTTVPAGGFVVFTEADFNPQPGVSPSFTLNSHGEEVYLFSADSSGNLTGFSDGFSFGAAENGVTFGRYVTSIGTVAYPPQASRTLGSANSGPKVGPVVFNEIQYHPFPGDEEFIELKNTAGSPVPLYDPANTTNHWKISGIDFEFPPGAEIPPNGLALVVPTDPVQFRLRNGVPSTVPIFGPYNGALEDNGELIELKRPDHPDVDLGGVVFVPYLVVDSVRYNDKAPWPLEPAGQGPSLERINPGSFGDDPVNWRASGDAASPGVENGGNRPPRVNAGADVVQESAAFPLTVNLSAIVSDDGQPKPPGKVSLAWVQVGGPAGVTFSSTNSAGTTLGIPSLGAYAFRLTASDGELQAFDDVTVIVRQPPAATTLVAKGSTWKYLDDGSNQGTAWRGANFSDSSWKSGPAQLGYGDGGEATTLDFGPNSNSKFITYYFRRTFTVSGAAQINSLNLSLVRDDGAVIYLNGQEAARDNMPEGTVTSSTIASTAVGGDAESQFFDFPIDTGLLREGVNTIAVEIHQSGGNSSDISFDLGLTGVSYGVNQPPVVNAGPDLSVVFGDNANLKGLVIDDGLPAVPGLTTNIWTRLSGPGNVAFANATVPVTLASFSTPGEYVLKLSASDGIASAEDTVAVSVHPEADPLETWRAAHFTAAELSDPQISGAGADPDADGLTNQQEYICGTDPRDAQSVLGIESAAISNGAAILKFRSVSGKSYSVQALDAVGGTWTNIGNVSAADSSGSSSIVDARTLHSSQFYRVVTPQQP
jgi:hypothetical protein